MKYVLIGLLPFFLTAQTEMKCEAGKCFSGKSSMQKPKNEKTNSQKISSAKILKKPSVEQLFNVKTMKVKSIISGKKQVNYGYIVAQDASTIDITAWFSGYVDTLYANNVYSKVKKGDILAKVYSPEVYKAKQDYLNSLHYNTTHTAPAMLESAKTKLELLGINEKEITQIQLTHKVDKLTNIYAPISGWIFQKNINKGSSFNTQKPLFQIINLDKVWMEVRLFQKELQTLELLTTFEVTTEGIEKTFKATKELLYPMLDPKMATATLRLGLENTKGLLKPGMYAKVQSSTNDETRLVVPRTAVIRKNGLWYAFLQTQFKGEYEPIPIEIQPLDALHYEVISGLTLNDTVVTNALFMMDSDAQINSIY